MRAGEGFEGVEELLVLMVDRPVADRSSVPPCQPADPCRLAAQTHRLYYLSRSSDTQQVEAHKNRPRPKKLNPGWFGMLAILEQRFGTSISSRHAP